MKRYLVLLIIASNAVLTNFAYSAANGGGVQGGSTGGASNVASSNSNVGGGNHGTGTGNSGSGNLGNETSTGSAGSSSVSSSTTGSLAPVDTTGSTASQGTGVQGGSTGGATNVASTNSNTGGTNNGEGLGNTGSGNPGNDTSTGSAGGVTTTTSTTTGGTTETTGGTTETTGGTTETTGGTTETTGGTTETTGGTTETTGGTTETTGGTTETTGGTTETTGADETGGTDETTTNGGTNGERRDIDVRVDFIPLIYADFVKTRRVINLTPSSNYPAPAANLIDKSLDSYQGTGCETQQQIPMQEQCTHFDFFRPIALEVDQFRDGFKVVDYYDFVIGAGGAANFSLVNAGRIASLFNATVGLLPMGGKSLKIERFVKTQKETQRTERELKRAKFPYKVETLFDNFNPGDSAEVTSMGGVLAFASAGFAGFQLGVNYLFNGTWKTTVQLGENKMVSVKVNKIKVHTIAGSAGVGVVTVAIDHFRNMDDSFSFMLDLSKKANVEIYQDLVRGHLIPAQKAAKGAYSGVQVVSSYKARTLGRKKVAYVGLPIFINKTWQSGVAETNVESLERDGKNYLIHVGSYFNNSSYRRINKTDDKVETFIGQLVVPQSNKGLPSLSAQFAWGFSTTDLWMPRMNYELNKFYKFSGLKNNFGVVIPNVKQLGNLTTSVELNIPHAGIMNLLSLPKGSLASFGSKILKSYFVAGDESKLCVAHPTSRVCQRVWRKKTEKSLERAEEILADMRSEKNADKFAKDFALLGQEMLDNQFAFQAILKSTCTSADFNVVVEGERVSRVVKKTLIANPCY